MVEAPEEQTAKRQSEAFNALSKQVYEENICFIWLRLLKTCKNKVKS